MALGNASRPPIVVGTDNGSLLEFAIEQKNGRNQLRLIRQFLGHDARVTALSVSPSGKLLASASIDGTVRIWRLDPARELVDTDFFTDGTRVIYLEPGGSAERAGISDGDSIRQFDGEPYYERIQKIQRGQYKPGDRVQIGLVRNDGRSDAHSLNFEVTLTRGPDIQEPILNLFFTKDDQWIAWNQCGFYNASPRGSRYVGWHKNQGRENVADFSLVSQFEQQLYQPSVVQRTVDTWHSDCRNIIEQPTLATENGDRQTYSILVPNTAENYEKMRPPKILVTSHQSSVTVNEDEVDVELSVESPSHLKTKGITLFNNGNLVRASFKAAPSTRNDGMTTTRYRVSLPVDPGENNLVFETKHKAASSNRAALKVISTKRDPNSQLPKLYVLAVGISQYEDERLNLDYADKDARDFAAAWEEQQGIVYSEVKSLVLANEKATSDDIEDGFDWLTDQEIGPKDAVFVFFSGRAFFSESDLWYFGGNELNLDKLKRTSISSSDLADLLEIELRDAGQVVAFLDTCRPSQLGKVHHSEFKDVWNGVDKQVVLSCYLKQTSQENKQWENGAFTHGLIRSLSDKKVDRNSDGFLALQELLNGTRKFVHKQTRQAQTPELSGSDLNFKQVNLAKIQTKRSEN